MPPCSYCDGRLEGDALYEDGLWSLRPLGAQPGRAVLWARRHAEAIERLTDDELRSLGPLLARCSQALRAAADAEKVYLTVFGEAEPHFHVVLAARGADVPPQRRGAALLVPGAAEGGDPARAAQVAQAIRRRLSAD